MSSAPLTLLLEPLRCAAPFSAYAFAVPERLQARAAASLLLCVEALCAGASAAGLGGPTLWLDTQDLHKDGGSKVLGANGRRWAPSMGFCFDPTARPPRKLEWSDLMDMEYGDTLQLDDRTAIHVARLGETASAYRQMAGRGLAVLLFFGTAAAPGATEAAVDGYMKNSQATMRPLMAPGQFQHFPFYLPLLTVEGILAATAEQISLWLGTADLYLRERDGQLLLVSRRDLRPMLTAAGLSPAMPLDSGAWVFPESILTAGANTA